MNRLIPLIILLFSVSSVALADDWPQFRGGDTHAAFVSDTIQPPLALQWKYKAGDKIVSSPAVSNGQIYFGSRDNKFYALDAESGDMKWSITNQNWIDSSPVVDGDNVYFSSRDGHLYSLKTVDGKQNWKHKTEGRDSSSPIVDGGLVFSGKGFPHKTIYALNTETGKVAWEYETDQMIYSSGAIHDGILYIGSNDGHVYALETATGKLKWKHKTNGGINVASPAIKGNQLFIAGGNFDWSIYAVDLESGDLNWTYIVEDSQPTPTYVSSVALEGEDLYFVSGYAMQYLYCLNSNSGALKWKVPLSPATRLGFSSSPVVTNNTVYVSSARGMLKAIDRATGDVSWEYNLGADVLSSVTIANGYVYIATLDGTLHAFR